MDIAKGTVLAQRYTLSTETFQSAQYSRWSAHDEKLSRDVAITIFPADGGHAEDALDAARRVAGLQDARIVRVLDAGQDDDQCYVVEEAHLGAHSLADLVHFEPLHPEEARRIIGETAAALESARGRGIHHLTLAPRHVIRLADGAIAINQLAVAGALKGRDDLPPADATGLDTRALIHLLYLALTGTWAGDPADIARTRGISLAEARADGQLPTPAELVDNIPGDLDALCRSALNHEQGPKTPGNVAREVSPWSAQMITAPGHARRTPEESPEAKNEEKPRSLYTVRKAPGQAPRPGVGAVGAAAVTRSQNGSHDRYEDDETDPNLPVVEPETPKKEAPVAKKSRKKPSEASATAGKETSAKAMPVAAAAAPVADEPAPAAPGYDPSFEELEPPMPGLSGATAEPDPSSSKFALAIVGVCVLVALILAGLGLHGFGGGKSAPAASRTPLAVPSSTSSSSSSSTSTSTQAPTPVKVVGATFVNSSGLRRTETMSLSNIIDGNTSTKWQSLHYLGLPWGGFRGYGGVALQMDDSTQIKDVKITPDASLPLTADVYVGDTPGTGGTKIGSVTNATTEQTVSGSAKGKYVTIFITTQGKPAGKRYFQSAISEVSLDK